MRERLLCELVKIEDPKVRDIEMYLINEAYFNRRESKIPYYQEIVDAWD